MNQQQHPTQIPRCHVLVPCAGMGQRALLPGASRPKQYALLEGLPLVTHTLQALSQVDPGAASDGAWHQGLRVAVVAPNDELWAKLVAPVAIGWRTAPVGGASRAESVLTACSSCMTTAMPRAATGCWFTTRRVVSFKPKPFTPSSMRV